MVKSFLTKSPFETKKLAENLAKKILKMKKRKAILLSLEGDLGSGKTVFLQGLARGLKIKEKILSPSFLLIRKFETPLPKISSFYHLDCYRIKKEKEILALGFKKIISNPKNIVAVEWADRIKKILPKERIAINFQLANKKKRKIKIKWPKD